MRALIIGPATCVASRQRIWLREGDRGEGRYIKFGTSLLFAETDVQDVFINNLAIVEGKLEVQNERGRIYRLDLKSGYEEGYWGYLLFWLNLGMIVFLASIRIWTRWREAPPKPATR